MTHKRFVIDITQEVINVATERDSGHCIVADAVRASIPGSTRVSVDLQTIRWSNLNERKRYIALTPASAQQILVDFDQGKRAEIGPQRLYVTPAQIIPMKREDGHARAKRKERNRKRVASNGDRDVPTVIGGAAPPTAALSNARGKIRRFGLRTLRA